MSDSLPQSVRSVPKHWIVLGLLVVAQTGLGVYCFETGFPRDWATATVLMGIVISQPALLAFWTGFAPQRFYLRFLWSFLLCTLISFADEMSANLLRSSRPDIGAMMILALGVFFTGTTLFVILRWMLGWQIKQLSVEDAQPIYHGSQYGIRHLLILMTIAAIACGLIRSLFFMSLNAKLADPLLIVIVRIVGVVSMMLCVVFSAIIIPWFLMAHRLRVLLLTVMMIAIGIACDLAAYYIMLATYPSPPRNSVYEEFVKPMLLIQLGAGLSMLVSSLVLRFCGFRMVRVPEAGR
jgi:hypothetical protein